MKMKIGTRVLAIKCANATTAEVFGYGTYDGDHPCPLMTGEGITMEKLKEIILEDVGEQLKWLADGASNGHPLREGVAEYCNGIMSRTDDDPKWQKHLDAANLKLTGNPRITLDSGEVVWGCMCWWGDAEEFDKKLEGMERVTVPVPKFDGMEIDKDLDVDGSMEDAPDDGPEIPDELDAEAELEAAADGDFVAEPHELEDMHPGWKMVDTSMDD